MSGRTATTIPALKIQMMNWVLCAKTVLLNWRTKMDRPKQTTWATGWMEYADWLEGENERLRKAGTKFLLNMWKNCGKGSTEFKVETDFVEEFYAALEVGDG
jgi:hypothetical protein